MLILWPEIEILRNVLQHVFLDGHSPSYKHPQNFSISSSRSMLLTYSGSLYGESTSLAFEQQVFLFVFDRVQRCLEEESMACGIVSVYFSERSSFRWNLAPNTGSALTLPQGSPSLFPAFLHTASHVSTISFLSLSFWKWPGPFALLENTLDSHVNGIRGTETPCLCPGKNHPLDILQSSFSHRGHTLWCICTPLRLALCSIQLTTIPACALFP